MTAHALTSSGTDDHVRVGVTPVYGLPVDLQTRCVHYAGPTDVIAIRFRCCGRFHPCHACHDAVADHPTQVWPADERGTGAILCGVCSGILTIDEYLAADDCPRCGAAFNPGCRLHSKLYFG